MNSTPLISHEMPLSLFPYHDFCNDYCYLLAHLLLKDMGYYNEKYANFYREKIKSSPYSILDNSLYELGDSIDYKLLYELGEEYKPSHLILPDCLNNREVTMERAIRYLADYGKQSTPKFIGVIQGKSLEELFQMFYFYSTIDQVDIIALPLYTIPKGDKDLLYSCMDEFHEKNPYKKIITSLNNDWIQSITEDMTSEQGRNKYAEIAYNLYRVGVVKELMAEFNNALPKKIHLLGCLTPNEYQFYTELDKSQMHSIDTSAPIVYGWNNVEIPKEMDFNLVKPKEKIAENLDKGFVQEQLDMIAKNIKTIRNFF
jgi:hypothetical protein